MCQISGAETLIDNGPVFINGMSMSSGRERLVRLLRNALELRVLAIIEVKDKHLRRASLERRRHCRSTGDVACYHSRAKRWLMLKQRNPQRRSGIAQSGV